MTDIAELFARDPHNLTDQDLDLIVQKYRDMRKQFNLGAKPKDPTKPAKQSKGAAILDQIGDIKL